MSIKNLTAIFIALFFAFSCNNAGTYTYEKETINSQDTLINVDVEYLVLKSDNAELNTWFEGINSTISNDIKSQIDTVTMFSKEFRETFASQMPPYDVMMTSTVFLSNKNILSVLYTTYMFSGGAHGNTDFTSYNYDMKNRQLLTVSKLFKPEAAQQINKLLSEYFVNPDNCFRAQPTLEEVTAINLASDSVIFTYGAYILGPYSCGPATVKVPIEAIKQYMATGLNLGI